MSQKCHKPTLRGGGLQFQAHLAKREAQKWSLARVVLLLTALDVYRLVGMHFARPVSRGDSLSGEIKSPDQNVVIELGRSLVVVDAVDQIVLWVRKAPG
jgi:ABC-type cobalamin transport system permease subunit